MQAAAATPLHWVVERKIQRALANGSRTTLEIVAPWGQRRAPPLTAVDATNITVCLRENPRFDTLDIYNYSLHDDAVLNVFRDGLPLCTSVTTVRLYETHLENEDLDRLRPAFYNTSVTKLNLYWNQIRGRRGGEAIRVLLVGNITLRELVLAANRSFGPEGAIGLGQGLTGNNRLQKLNLNACYMGNDGLANLLLSMGETNNMSLTHLDLNFNRIEGEDGGRQLCLLLQCFPALKVLDLNSNNLGPLGAHALAPGLATAIHLESLDLRSCHLGNDGMGSIVPDGQVNRSLTTLDLDGSNDIQGIKGAENVIALAARCTNLDSIRGNHQLSPDQQRRLNLLLERNRLCTEASALGGSTFPVLFRFVEKAHHHEHGLSAIFVILQNDGDDYFCTALNRAIE